MRRAQCLAPERHIDAPLDAAAGRYGRLFGELDALVDDETQLLALCGPGGVCDGGRGYASAQRTEAGWPFFGQLIAHDITADRSPLMHGARADQLVNSRTPPDGPRFYRPGPQPRIPLEFADAAFRYGHSQVREGYVLNDRSGRLTLFPDLLGFAPVPAERTIDWSRLFDVPGHDPAQRAKRIDGALTASLIALPQAITGDVEVAAQRALSCRDLQRGHSYGLPSGESVARAMGERALSDEEVGLAATGWRYETPLWYYVLREADVRADGEGLGPVGGRIVTEVLLGIIDADPRSYRANDPDWSPPLPSRGAAFTLADMLVPLHA